MAIASVRRNGNANPLIKFLRRQGANFYLPIMGVIGFLVVWQILSSTKILSLPGPIQVLADERSRYLIFHPFYYKSPLDQGLARQTLISLTRVGQGYGLAAVVGIAVGILVGTSTVLNKALDPIFQFLRMVAPLAWVPISLAALRQNEPAAIFVIFITAIWPILINTAVGVREIPQDYKNVSRVLRLSKKTFFLKILLPSALPYIFTGLRIAIGLAWLAIIAAEIVMSGVAGIGFFIWDAYQQNYVSEIIVAVIYIGAVGLILDRFVGFLQTKIAPANR
ncbi:high-affinity ABC-type bicarbonate uptake system permease component CmpB [Thermosynechococcus sp. NK55a]|jgi:bicarbonate transport system permease protein|uniref:nitrate ABC transporter permease n=1 Tax=unclassified Thermosynechococcus TaxID=2622553 RepID=UPI0003D7C0AA|nr:MULTISPECIES: nitrate ABC transporter permease [unclassified Thermosynechococcus]AHB88637.1 high-affinity ABC-type bicarbonate uptake system permease component CmpB [Thermosynechococcus sp. NK55a]